MSKEKIEKLTPEQEGLIPAYLDKWKKIALSIEPIDREKAGEAVKKAYVLINLPEPNIIFCDSPYAIERERELVKNENLLNGNLYTKPEIFQGHFTSYLLAFLTYNVRDLILGKLGNELQDKLLSEFYVLQEAIRTIFFQIEDRVLIQLSSKLESQKEQIVELGKKRWKLFDVRLNKKQNISIMNYAANKLVTIKNQQNNLDIIFSGDILISHHNLLLSCCLYDFCINVLTSEHRQLEWEILQAIAKNCGLIFPFENIAIICDRPRILSFDNQQRLHAEGVPAIQYADGYSLYAYHGVILPAKYGKIHPHNWQTSWLLEEEDAELRQVLIEGIGYDRITEELGAIDIF